MVRAVTRAAKQTSSALSQAVAGKPGRDPLTAFGSASALWLVAVTAIEPATPRLSGLPPPLRRHRRRPGPAKASTRAPEVAPLSESRSHRRSHLLRVTRHDCRTPLPMNMGRSYEADRNPSAMVTVTL